MKPIKHTCPICNVEFNGRATRIYCSRLCSLKAPKTAWNKGTTGVSPGKPKNGTDKTCAHCAKIFYTPACYPDAQFCSMECYHLSRWSGSRKQIRQCTICKTEFEVTEAVDKLTCSDVCKKSQKRLTNAGDKSTFWRGGKATPYGFEWKTIREAAKDRDGHKCVLCDSVDRIQVHHKNPYRYSKSHALDNLITLCRSCHSKEELLVNKHSAGGLKARWPEKEINGDTPQ